MPTDNEYLRQIASQLSTSPSPSPSPSPSGVMIAAGENHIGEVGGNLGQAAVNFARPNDSTPYAAGDAVGGVLLTFTNLSRINGGWGYISKAMCTVNQATMPGQLRLHLFNFAALAVVADNAPFTYLAVENGNYQGWVDFTTFITGSAGSTASRSLGQLGTLTSMPFQAQSTSRSLFGIVETLNAWTAAQSQQFTFYLTGDRY